MKPIDAILETFGLNPKVGVKFKINLDEYKDRIFWFDQNKKLKSNIELDDDTCYKLLYYFVYKFDVKDITLMKAGPILPEKGERYYYLGSAFNGLYSEWANDIIDWYRYYTTLLFATSQEVYEYRDFLKLVYRKSRSYNPETSNYFFVYNTEEDKIEFSNSAETYYGERYYFDFDDIVDFQKRVGEDKIKKYLFYKRGGR